MVLRGTRPGRYVGVCLDLSEEQINGLLEAVSPVRLGEKQELSHWPNEVRLVR